MNGEEIQGRIPELGAVVKVNDSPAIYMIMSSGLFAFKKGALWVTKGTKKAAIAAAIAVDETPKACLPCMTIDYGWPNKAGKIETKAIVQVVPGKSRRSRSQFHYTDGSKAHQFGPPHYLRDVELAKEIIRIEAEQAAIEKEYERTLHKLKKKLVRVTYEDFENLLAKHGRPLNWDEIEAKKAKKKGGKKKA